MSSIDGTEVEDVARSRDSLRSAWGLLDNRQRLLLILLTLGRIAVGFCDLLVAAALYLLFLLLQGRSTGHQHWWIPKVVFSAAVITTVLVIVRCVMVMDLLLARYTFRQIQNLHTVFLLRLTKGYSQREWDRFVECNRSELSGRALHTTAEAADF